MVLVKQDIAAKARLAVRARSAFAILAPSLVVAAGGHGGTLTLVSGWAAG